MYHSTPETRQLPHSPRTASRRFKSNSGWVGLLALFCFLIPSLSTAQTVNLEGTSITKVYGQSDCNNNTTLSFSFKFTPTTTVIPSSAATPAKFKVYLGNRDTQTGVLLFEGDLTVPTANPAGGGAASTEVTGTFNGTIDRGNEDADKGMTVDGKLTVRDLIGYQFVLDNPGQAPNENTLCNLAAPSSSTGEVGIELYVVAEYYTNSTQVGGAEKQTAEGNEPVRYDLTPPNAPDKPSLSPSESSVTLSWTTKTGFQYDVYYSTVSFTSSNAAKNAIAYNDCKQITDSECKVSNLTNGKTYYFAIRAYDAAGNVGAFSPIESGSPIELTDFFEAYNKSGGKDTGFSGGYCFLATAAFGTYDNRYVQILRDFRDRVLMTNGAGRSFVAWYYEHSPSWAAALRKSPTGQTVMKVVLLPMIAFAALFVRIPWWATLLGLMMLVMLVRLRRSRRLVTSVAALALLSSVAFLPATAKAQDDDTKTSSASKAFPNRSERNFGLEIRLGPYYPSIDSEDGLTTKPYNNVFNDAYMLSIGLNFEWLFFKTVGSFGLYGGAGVAWTTAQAQQGSVSSGLTAASSGLTIQQDTTDTTDTSTDTSKDTTLWVIPLQLGLSYRFDYFTQQNGFPLVPYIRGGVDYYLWFVSSPPNGELAYITNSEGNKQYAVGGRFGFHFAVGFQFLLDVLDRRTARNFDLEFGVNHSYLFVEYHMNWIGVLTPGLNLSDSALSTGTIRAGLMFQF